jgi:hypothetical protein
MANEEEDYQSVADSYAGFASAEKIYLLRVVKCRPGGAGEYANRFEASIESLRERSPSLAPLGAWRTVYGPYDEVTHLHEFDNLADLEADVELLQAESPGPASSFDLQESRTSKILRGLIHCPQPIEMRGEIEAPDRRICMMVNVRCTRAGMGNFIEHFASGIENRRGLARNLVPFDSLEDMDDLRRVLYRDETFQSHIKINTSPVLPNFWEWGGYSKLMKPLSYSQMR